jgi:hypothetical protein
MRDVGLIDLNPEGRRQNKKYRATVRELPSQTKWLDAWEKDAARLAAKGEKRKPQYCTYASVVGGHRAASLAHQTGGQCPQDICL